jgi:hypothetical protein
LPGAGPHHAGIGAGLQRDPAAQAEPRRHRLPLRGLQRADLPEVPVKLYAGSRIELAPNFTELERPREQFSFTHLPEDVEALFKEALACFSSGCYNAFASMCRRTALAVFAELGEGGKLRLYDELGEVRKMAEVDDATFAMVRKVLFDAEPEGRSSPPLLGAFEAGVLLEIVKDLLYEAYVRRGRLQQAMTVRRFFSEAPDSKVTPLEKARS